MRSTILRKRRFTQQKQSKDVKQSVVDEKKNTRLAKIVEYTTENEIERDSSVQREDRAIETGKIDEWQDKARRKRKTSKSPEKESCEKQK